jgi:hypothetical protein
MRGFTESFNVSASVAATLQTMQICGLLRGDLTQVSGSWLRSFFVSIVFPGRKGAAEGTMDDS